MNTHEYCVHWILTCAGVRASVLDYGCGAGEVVAELRRRNVEAYGCDVFYDGGDYSEQVDPSLRAAGIIRRMQDERAPFGDSTFDVVVNNQVMEHVPNLNVALQEIRRVLKPGGVVLSLFPDKGVWREGHCGIPFLHWFPRRSRVRIVYAALFRAAGFGYHKGGKGVMHWSRDICDWLDAWTHYRTRREIDAAYRTYFDHLEHIEDRWLTMRFDRHRRILGLLPRPVQRFVARKAAGVVLEARRAAA